MFYPSPSRKTCVSLHTGRTSPMVHWSLQAGKAEWLKIIDWIEIQSGAFFVTVQHCNRSGHTHLSELGKSIPSSTLSCLLARVETMIRYLTLTALTDSSCTAWWPCKRKELQLLKPKHKCGCFHSNPWTTSAVLIAAAAFLSLVPWTTWVTWDRIKGGRRFSAFLSNCLTLCLLIWNVIEIDYCIKGLMIIWLLPTAAVYQSKMEAWPLKCIKYYNTANYWGEVEPSRMFPLQPKIWL